MTKDELVAKITMLIWSNQGGNEGHACTFKEAEENDSYSYKELAEEIVEFIFNNKEE